FQNRKGTKELLTFFDHTFTFDPHDSEVYQLQFRPLFYIGLYNSRPTDNFKYDLLFTGTAHTDRVLLANRIAGLMPAGSTIGMYFFLSSKLLFIVKKIFEKNFRKVQFKNI